MNDIPAINGLNVKIRVVQNDKQLGQLINFNRRNLHLGRLHNVLSSIMFFGIFQKSDITIEFQKQATPITIIEISDQFVFNSISII